MQFNDLGKQWEEIREEALLSLDRIGLEGSYIGGKDIDLFEKKFSQHIGIKHSAGVSNGTDGLKIALRALDLGDKDAVIIPANTFIADYISIKHLPTSPKVVLIDHDLNYCIDTGHLEKFLFEERGKYEKVIIIPVHLYGHSCNMDLIMELSNRFDCLVIEDCSQSHETYWRGNHTGTFGHISVFSLYPGKNLGAIGDAGVVCTNSDEIAERVKTLRNYGSKIKYHYEEVGYNNRIDSIQASFLSMKLDKIKNWTEKKRKIAEKYHREIKNAVLPPVNDNCNHSYHIFCIRVKERDKFISSMNDLGIPCLIHYPIPIHKTKIWDNRDIIWSSDQTDLFCGEIVSIPLHPYLSDEETDLIISSINSFKP